MENLISAVKWVSGKIGNSQVTISEREVTLT